MSEEKNSSQGVNDEVEIKEDDVTSGEKQIDEMTKEEESDKGKKKKDSMAKKMAAKLKKKGSKEELKEMEGKYLRALADYQNLIKQSAKEKSDFIKYANAQFVMDILPVFDNLKMAVAGAGESNDAWLEGVKYVVKQFQTVLDNCGVKEIEAEGKKFDPNFMEAIEGEGDKVKKVVKAGYIMNDRVLVAARVIVE